MNNFVKKGYGRIYVTKKEDIEIVKQAIKEVDEYEYSYFGDDIISVYNGKPELVYTHKFEIDIDKLTNLCWSKGVYIWCISQNYEDRPGQFEIKIE